MKKIKSRVDFYKYLFFLNKIEGMIIVINIVLFIISLRFIYIDIKNFELITKSGVSSILLFLLSLLNIIWMFIIQIKDIKTFSGNNKKIEMKKVLNLYHGSQLFEFKNIKPVEDKYNYILSNSKKHESAIFSEKINEYLLQYDLLIKYCKEKPKEIKNNIIKNADILTPFFKYRFYNSKKNDKYFYNEKKFCLSSDLEIGENCLEVKCHKGSYFDSFLTNEVSSFKLERTRDLVVIYNASNFYPCKRLGNTLKLESIAASKMNNHIGVSTIAFLKNNSIVIRLQNNCNQVNSGLLVPAGSGSCDWNDKLDSSFNKTIIRGMNRELKEENNLNDRYDNINTIKNTKIIGYFRWVDRGGKPEFVGITKLNIGYEYFSANPKELVDINHVIELQNIDSIPIIVNQLLANENISLPLEMNLTFLKNYYNNHKQELKKFLDL